MQFPTTLEKGLSKLMSLKDAYGGMLSQVSRMVGMGSGPGQEDMLDSMLGKIEQLKVCRGGGNAAVPRRRNSSAVVSGPICACLCLPACNHVWLLQHPLARPCQHLYPPLSPPPPAARC